MALKKIPYHSICNQARIRVANYGGYKTNLYLHKRIYKAGEVIQPKRANIVVPHDSVIVFADDYPSKNWGHPCRYLFHDPVTGDLTGELNATMPPAFDFGKEFKPFHMPSSFSNGSKRTLYPLLSIPPGIYQNDALEWYAILYSGLSSKGHLNDIEFLYRTLVNTYGVPATNITVLNFDGTLDYNVYGKPAPKPVGNWPGDNTPYQVQINGPGTKPALLNALAALGPRLKPTDNLFLHTSNHGHILNQGLPNAASTICAYQGDEITATDLGSAIAALPPFQSLAVMMQQCYSGGFIDPILAASRANNTAIATAANANSASDAWDQNGNADFDPFAVTWISAMALANPDGSSLSSNPDTDGDGQVSMLEAFNYAKANEPAYGDSPQYKQQGPAAGNISFGANRKITVVPQLARHPSPENLLLNNSPANTSRLSHTLNGLLKEKSFRQSLIDSLASSDNYAKVLRSYLSNPNSKNS